MAAEIVKLMHAWKEPPGYRPPAYDKYEKAKPVQTNALYGNLYEAKCGARVPWEDLGDDFTDTTCPSCNKILTEEVWHETTR